MDEAPVAIMLSGPNGAGKTTTATTLFHGSFRHVEYVNADVIAQGLSGANPDSVAVEAGAIMLRRLRDLAAKQKDLAFESTGAARSFAPWLRGLISQGYTFHLYFFWLKDANAAIARVAQRVRMGGHDVPAETIRRRYDLGLRNFFRLYLPLATRWELIDNNAVAAPRTIARGGISLDALIDDVMLWNELYDRYGK